LAFGISPCTGQDVANATPELDRLKAVYQRELETLRADGLRAHIESLAALESAYRERGDVTAAEQIKRTLTTRRRELTEFDSSAGSKATTVPDGAQPISLLVREAQIGGSVRRARTTLSNWTTAASTATWVKRDIRPGRYDVYLDFIAIREGGGPIELRELHQTAEVDIPSAEVNPSRGSIKAATFNVRSSLHLKISSKGRGRNGIFYLTGVRLVPAR
jgi:hypothetical protein